jgi:hypothetical protein
MLVKFNKIIIGKHMPTNQSTEREKRKGGCRTYNMINEPSRSTNDVS